MGSQINDSLTVPFIAKTDFISAHARRSTSGITKFTLSSTLACAIFHRFYQIWFDGWFWCFKNINQPQNDFKIKIINTKWFKIKIKNHTEGLKSWFKIKWFEIIPNTACVIVSFIVCLSDNRHYLCKLSAVTKATIVISMPNSITSFHYLSIRQ